MLTLLTPHSQPAQGTVRRVYLNVPPLAYPKNQPLAVT